jgi:hypothetical protein
MVMIGASWCRKLADTFRITVTEGMGPGVRRDDGGVFVGVVRKSLRFEFQTATGLRSRAAAQGELLVCLPKSEGRRSADRRIVNKPRLVSRIAGKQHHTATPFGAPSRRLKTLVRSSGDVATLGDFAPHACPRPASSQWQSPVVGPDGNPGPPEPVLARHNLRRRIRPAWVTPPRPSSRSVPLQARL